MSKIALLERVAEEWNRIGITYAVAHGIDDYPARVGRDLDVLVARRDIARAIDAAEQVLEASGLRVGRPPRLWGERLIASLDGPTPDMLEVHAIPTLTWTGSVLADRPRPSERVGPFAIDPWVSFVKRVLIPLLAGASSRWRDAPSQLATRASECEAARHRLPPLIGAPLAASLLRAIAARDITAAERQAPAVRRALAVRGPARHPGAALALLTRALRRKLAQPFSPCAPVVAVVAPPAIDRQAILRTIADGDRLIFTRCVVRAWGAPARRPVGAGGSGAPTRIGAGRHWLRLAAHYGFALRTALVRDRFASMRQQLVLYDGCALDMVADPARFRLASARGARLCWHLLPKPDLILLITARHREGAADADAARWERLLAHEHGVAAVQACDGALASLRCEALAHIARTFVHMHERQPAQRFA